MFFLSTCICASEWNGWIVLFGCIFLFVCQKDQTKCQETAPHRWSFSSVAARTHSQQMSDIAVHVNSLLTFFFVCICRFSMTAAAGVLTGLAKLKRQDSARSQHRPLSAAGLGNAAPESAPRWLSLNWYLHMGLYKHACYLGETCNYKWAVLLCATTDSSLICIWLMSINVTKTKSNLKCAMVVVMPQTIRLHKPSVRVSLSFFSFRKRKRRTDVVVVRGKLRLYSASGFFLLLGLLILAVGIGMATLGYWPHSESMPPAKSQTRVGPKTATAGGAQTSATGDGNKTKIAATDGDVGNSSAGHHVQGQNQFLWKIKDLCCIPDNSELENTSQLLLEIVQRDVTQKSELLFVKSIYPHLMREQLSDITQRWRRPWGRVYL